MCCKTQFPSRTSHTHDRHHIVVAVWKYSESFAAGIGKMNRKWPPLPFREDGQAKAEFAQAKTVVELSGDIQVGHAREMGMQFMIYCTADLAYERNRRFLTLLRMLFGGV